MSIERPANERLALYERFKRSLAKGAAGDSDDEFFDADDLVIIIDQAVDLEDEYVEIEAIMRGYRFFPDNEELATRRAFLYYDLNLDEGVDNVRATLPADAPLTRILGLRRMDGSADPEVCTAMLDSIVGSPDMLDDETIIQLVDCASACNCYEWLKKNEARLRKKTDYLPTLLYELFIVSDLRHDRDYSLKLLEELTEIEPFNIDFWNALAQVQAEKDDDSGADAALNALEFALAIDSDNPEALTLKASILLKQGNADEAERTLRPVADANPTATAAQIYVCALIELNNQAEAIARLEQFCEAFPEDRDLFSLALAMNHPIVQAMFAHSMANATDSAATINDWNQRAEAYYRDGRINEARSLFEMLHHHEALHDSGYKMLFSALYTSGQYNRCIILYGQMQESRPDFLLSEMALATIMSYLQLGNKTNAKRAFKEITARFPMNLRESWTMATAIESIGMGNFMAALKTMMSSSGPLQPELLDIFEYPYNKSTEQE